MQSTELQV